MLTEIAHKAREQALSTKISYPKFLEIISAVDAKRGTILKLLDKVDSCSELSIVPRKNFSALTSFDYDTIHYRFELMIQEVELRIKRDARVGDARGIQASYHEAQQLYVLGVGYRNDKGIDDP